MSAQKLIIDTDPGVDDVLAILLALASPELDVALISIVFGNTHAPLAHTNVLKIYHLLAQEMAAEPAAAERYGRLSRKGKEKTMLAIGADDPVGGEKAVAAYFHGLDGLSNISTTHPEFNIPPIGEGEVHEHLDISPRPSPELMLELLDREPPRTVTIVALGPLSNLAIAYRAAPSTFSRVHSVVWMGGALDAPGNIAQESEFNCYADPFAACELVEAVKRGEFDLVICPLDITVPHLIPFDDLIDPSFATAIVAPNGEAGAPSTDPVSHAADSAEAVQARAGSSAGKGASDSAHLGPLRTFISAMLVRVRGLQASFGLPDAMEMHDPVAVWYALAQAQARSSASAPPPGWELVQRNFAIERVGEWTRGMCVVDRRGTGNEGEKRSEVEELKQETIARKLPPKDEEHDRQGNKVRPDRGMPFVVTRTPGKEELRRVLLGRVFGTEV